MTRGSSHPKTTASAAIAIAGLSRRLHSGLGGGAGDVAVTSRPSLTLARVGARHPPGVMSAHPLRRDAGAMSAQPRPVRASAAGVGDRVERAIGERVDVTRAI